MSSNRLCSGGLRAPPYAPGSGPAEHKRDPRTTLCSCQNTLFSVWGRGRTNGTRDRRGAWDERRSRIGVARNAQRRLERHLDGRAHARDVLGRDDLARRPLARNRGHDDRRRALGWNDRRRRALNHLGRTAGNDLLLRALQVGICGSVSADGSPDRTRPVARNQPSTHLSGNHLRRLRRHLHAWDVLAWHELARRAHLFDEALCADSIL